MNMNHALLAAAIGGILAGTTACGGKTPQPATSNNTPSTIGSEEPSMPASSESTTSDKHACKGHGSCKTDKHECKGQNKCKGHDGGPAT